MCTAINALLAGRPQGLTAIELVTCQWIDPKEYDVDPRLCLDLKDLEKIDFEKLHEFYEVGHLIREMLNFTIVAFKRGNIEPGITTEDLIDSDIWPEFTETDQLDVLDTFKFDTLEDLIETLRVHMGLLAFLDEADSLDDLDHDTARLASSLVYREYAESNHKVKDSPRLRFFLKSLSESKHEVSPTKSIESYMTKFKISIFNPVTSINWQTLAIERGILVSG